jgi:predicted dehydrogenase
MTATFSRRSFLSTAVASATTGVVIGHDLFSRDRPKPSERITLGFIGVGVMGRGHLGAFLGMTDVQVVAVCDVVRERRDNARKMVEDRYAREQKSGQFKGCQASNDFRDILERKDIDAVLIATPDHWHAFPCIQAARARKHIYCEKPLTHHVAEGRKIVDEVAKGGVIFQTGSQQRSEFGGHFRKAVEYVRNGRLGKIEKIRIGVGGPAVPCDLPDQPVPDGTDWDRWLGPAPQRGYNEILCPKGIHGHFPAWRNYREYAGGGLADMGAHHFDIAQWALDMDNSGPVKVLPPEKGNQGLRFIYASGVEMTHGGEADCVFVGTRGIIRVSRDKINSDPAEILNTPIGASEFHVYPSSNHRRNWIESIRSGKPCICPAEVGNRSATICHLGNIGYRLRRDLRWDPVHEVFIEDAEANKLLVRQARQAWQI